MPEKMEAGKRVFLMAPFVTDTRSQITERHKMYGEFKASLGGFRKIFREAGGTGRFFEEAGVGRRAKFGTLLDILRLPPVPQKHPVGQFLHKIFQLYQVADPAETRKAHVESLQLVRQLNSLGHEVRIHDLGDKRHSMFLRAAIKAGAKREAADPEEARDHLEKNRVFGAIYSGMGWARDHHVKIDGVLEKPSKDLVSLALGVRNFFGEGGATVQVGPKEWLVTDDVMRDPRLRKYEAKGHSFVEMPDGIQYDRTLSDLLGEPVYNSVPHIDFNLGAVPERKVVAVCPNYASEHKLSVELMKEKLGVKIVEVPKEEADRHPANFLPLGEGRVLVDSGAPKFIELLREAGVEVIPTAVPLNHLLINKGGLHCLFNEL